MIRDRRSLERGLYWAVSLLGALAVVVSAQPVAAAPRMGASFSPNALSADPFPTRIEGYLKSVTGLYWLVDQTPVLRGPHTTLIETKGIAKVGAFVLVAGLQFSDHLDADTIEILRPEGAAPPSYQFTGTVRKQGSAAWVIEDTVVDITVNTQIIGQIATDNLVRVTIQRNPNGVEALEIRAIAKDAASVPFAIEGTVEQVTGNAWVVDNETVLVPPERGVTANQGDTVEVSAVTAGDGSLVAREARIVDTSGEALLDGYVTAVNGLGEDNQTWTLQVFDGARAEPRTLHIAPATYVDEDRAVIETGVEAQVQGLRRDATSVDAALVRLQQPVPATAAGELLPAGAGGMWQVGNAQVWFESTELVQAAQTAASPAAAGRGSAGAQPLVSTESRGPVVVRGVRLRSGVIVAKEVLSRDAARTSGILFSAGAASGGATALTQADWYGPTGISPSLNEATKPTVLFDASGGAHSVYESQGKIYYAYQRPGEAWGPPQKIGTGSKPVAVFDFRGQLHVAYTNEFLQNYDILHVRLTPSGWTLPRVVAPTSGNSDDPVIAADATGKVYVAWMDYTSGEWAVQIGTWDGSYWTSSPVSNGRGQSPALTVMPDGAVFLAWQDRIPLGDNTWGNYDIFASERKDRWTWSLPVNISNNRTFRPGSNSLGARVVGISEGAGQALAHVAWIDDADQVRYIFGRGGYWPIPMDVTGKRTSASGLSMQIAEDGQLYIAWDEGISFCVTVARPRANIWPEPGTVALRNTPLDVRVWDVSLAPGSGGIALTWVQNTADGKIGVYESRHGMPLPMLKSYLPFVVAP